MTQKPDHLSDQRFAMRAGAWGAARALFDYDGALVGDVHEAAAKFMRRKCCAGLPKEDCQAAFRTAVGIAEAAIHFRRSSCGHNQPLIVRQYELLLSLAKSLESDFPDAGDYPIRLACKQLEYEWER